MFHRLLGLVLVPVLIAGLAPAAAAKARYEPTTTAIFNNPWGSPAQKHRISIAIEDAVRAAPKRSTIRISQYAFSRPESATALIRAHRRGVNVRLVVNDHEVSSALKRLQKAVGTDTSARSFAIVCRAGCRSPKSGNHHSKFLTFSRLGSADKVVMVGSGNLTHRAGGWQFNDHVVITGQRTLYAVFTTVFDDMAQDRPVTRPYWPISKGRYTAEFLPVRDGGVDPIKRELAEVRCRGVDKGWGRNGRTVVRVSMWTWSGSRGMDLARHLRRLDRRGCHVEVLVGAPGRRVLAELRRPGTNGGIAVRDTRVDRNRDGEVDRAVHHKYLLINGRIGGDRSARRVITGSLNWTTHALTHGDELVLGIDGRAIHKRYNGNFRWIWRNHGKILPNRPLPDWARAASKH